MSAIRNMDSYLKGVDMHEFLASIGKHAIEKVTQGSSDMRTVKPECSNMVFVEDTDELARFDNGCGIGDKEDKGFTFGEWRERTQQDNTSRWGAKKKVTAHECKENLQMEDNSGWGEEIEVTPSGWESSTQKENKSGWEMKEDCPGGWDKRTHQEDNAGWGEEKKVAPAGWGKGKQRVESCTGWGSNTQMEGNAGWGDEKHTTAGRGGENKVAPGVWGKGSQEEDNAGWGNEKDVRGGWGKGTREEHTSIGWRSHNIQKDGWGEEKGVGWGEEKNAAYGGWDRGIQKEDTHIGWGSSIQKEGNAGFGEEKKVTAGGWEEERKVVSARWGKGIQKEDTSIGWGSSTQRKGIAGWRETNAVIVDGRGEEKKVFTDGWGKDVQKKDTCIESSTHRDGWEEEKEVTAGGWGEVLDGCPGGWGKGAQEDTCSGGGSRTQKEGTARWEEAKKVTADGWGQRRRHKVDDGWGEEKEVAAGGWGEEKDIAPGRWGKGAQDDTHSAGERSTQKGGTAGWEEAKEGTADGWGQTTRQKVHDGWGEEKEVTAGGWGEEKDVAPGGWGKGAQDDTHSAGGRSSQKGGTAGWEEAKEGTADGWGQTTWQKVHDGWGEEKEVTAGGWGDEKDVAPGGWGKGAQDDTRSAGGSSTQKEGTAGWEEAKGVNADGWRQSTKQKVDDGWGEMEDDSGITGRWGENILKKDNYGWGLAQNVSTRNKDVLLNSVRVEADDPPLDGRWGGKQEVVTGDNNGWDCPFKNDTRKTDSADGWDSMQGQNPRNRPKKGWSTRSVDPLVSTESHGADERRIGTFGPSGSNTVPLGKRKSLLKAGNAEKGHGQSDWAPQLERGSEGSDSTNQFVTSDSLGRRTRKSVPESETPNANVSSMRMESEEDGWAISEQSQPQRNESLGGSALNSKTDHEALADSDGWGSELPTSNTSQVDGWNDTNPDAQGETLRPNKRFNRRFTGNSWTDPVSNGPHNQNRWPRLKALITLPEYSELGELYKATNKILHYNGYQPGDKLNPEDEKFVLEKILVHHRDKEAKLGCGVEYVMIDSHSDHQVSCFWVVRKDGSKTDFSYWKCLENLFEMKYPHVEMKEVHQAGKDWGMGTKSAAPPFRRRHPQEVDREEAKDGW